MESCAQDNTIIKAPDTCQAITESLEGLRLSSDKAKGCVLSAASDQQPLPPRPLPRLLKLPNEILQKIGTYLCAIDIAAFTSTSSHVYKVCRYQFYKGWWDLCQSRPEHTLHDWAVSSNFLAHARAFKVSLLHPNPLQNYTQNSGRVPSSKPIKIAKGYVTRIFESARQVSALHITCGKSELVKSHWCSEWLDDTAKLALRRRQELQTLQLGGFWSPGVLRTLQKITTSLKDLRIIYLNDPQFSGDTAGLFFKHIFHDFPELKSLTIEIRVEQTYVVEDLKDAALAAPSRLYEHLAIALYPTDSVPPIHLIAAEARAIAALLSFEASDITRQSCGSIGINAQTLAEVVHVRDFLNITSLSLSFPLEARHDYSRMRTDIFVECLPDSFVYENKITTLELKTSEPHDIIMTLVTPQTRRGATTLPFPRLCLLRATLPRWKARRSRETSRETGTLLRQVLQTRGVALEWGYEG